MSRPLDVLLLTDAPDRLRQWARHLTDCDIRLWQGPQRLAAGMTPDVIVTDGMIAPASLPDVAMRSRLAAGDVGLVCIGADGPADVCLPRDCTARELRVTVRLLAQVVRLRRERKRALRAQRLLRELAMSDPLTGMPNRRAWDDILQRCARKRLAVNVSRCVALLDLDHFKAVNDTLGHTAGDEVLRHIGKSLTEGIGNKYFAARLGGDEFALLLDPADPATVEAELESLRHLVCEGAPHKKITASIGYAIGTKIENMDTLVHYADRALLQAKTAGRDCCVAAPLSSD